MARNCPRETVLANAHAGELVVRDPFAATAAPAELDG
jgi:hypothetical protein